MNTPRFPRFLVIMSTVVAMLIFDHQRSDAATEHPDPGVITRAEFRQIPNHLRLDKVDDICGCTGHLRAGYSWLGTHGHWHRHYVYAGPEPTWAVIVQYRQWSNGSWHVNRTKWICFQVCKPTEFERNN